MNAKGTIRLTYPTPTCSPAGDRAATELDERIEVTPAMIAAGEKILLCALGGAVTIFWDADELAKSVFLAMTVAARESSRPPAEYRKKTVAKP